MNDPTQNPVILRKTSVVFLSGIIAVSFVGYFVGIFDGTPGLDATPAGRSLLASTTPTHPPSTGQASVLPATSYSAMRRRENGPTSRWKPTLDQIPQPKFDLFAEIKPSEQQKQASTLTRAARRAYNGAPPVIPHLVERTADAACYACHGKGMRIGDKVANQMSHGFLANCTQCHAPPPPKPFDDAMVSVQNSFVGLPAPTKGERAYPGAPPTIPHSTWMRQTCLSCHGNEAGWAGLQSTHPWRINCQQCHAPSARLDQAVVPSEIGFLPPIDVTVQ
ncbi:MAG: diheme cytochrome c precursor [Pirellulaceae bacterium]|nr:diheme cytochrome c precursor [Pirellulaceae bacterium]